jgi:hypothetical protein
MNRKLVGGLIASALTVMLAACDVGLSGSVGGYAGGSTSCSPYLSCDTCTPVSGCGWCIAPGGAGVCASDPDDCPTSQFSWTWDPKGCRVAADASVGPSDDDVAVPVIEDAATRTDGNADSSHIASDASSG